MPATGYFLDDDGVGGLARVEADGDARAGEVVVLARELRGVERLGGFVVDAVERVVVVDVNRARLLVADDVEDFALGDAARGDQRAAALGLAVHLLAPEVIKDAHATSVERPER